MGSLINIFNNKIMDKYFTTILDFLEKNNSIKNNKRDIYEYGYELLISTLITIITIIFLGLLSGKLLSTIIFLFYFMPIRTVAGGYHAKTHVKCLILSNIIGIFCVNIFPKITNFIALFFILGISECYIFFNAPCKSKINPLKEDLLKRNKLYMHRIQFIEIFVIFILFLFKQCEFINIAIFTTMIVAGMIFIDNFSKY